MRGLLQPVSKIYSLILRQRNFLYDRGLLRAHKVGIPVICVGNVTTGGNGKTPLCLLLYRFQEESGKKPVILTRGYQGSEKGPVLVESFDYTRFGDEACLMARQARVVVSRDRVAGARFIEKNGLGDIIILDDGMQHRRLGRDINILSVFSGNERAIESFLKGRLLPLGEFREPLQPALSRIDLVVLSHRRPKIDHDKEAMQKLRARFGNLPCFESYLKVHAVRGIKGELKPGTRIAAFCGLANPEGFYQTLEDAGYLLAERETFKDHHAFSELEIERLLGRVGTLPLVCTEKDAVKLAANQKQKIYVLSTSTEILNYKQMLQIIENRIVSYESGTR
jgi:tetraacyldisaccharide 4'-kinase